MTVDALSHQQAVDEIVSWLEEPEARCRYVVTPNLDHAVLLSAQPALRAAYEGASLVVADGMPLVWAARLRGTPLPERVAGSDLGPGVLASVPPGTRVFLLGGAPETSELAAAAIVRDYPRVELVGRLSPRFGFEQSEAESEEVAREVARARPRLVLVGLGAPKQELWVHRHRALLEGMVVLCLGATVDFFAGTKKRAPAWMQRSGLEWFHRLATEPRRLARRYAKDAFHLPGLLLADWRAGRGEEGEARAPSRRGGL